MTREAMMRREYQSRINRVLDYIEKHIDQEFTLDELAGVANFSKYHFHRIFFGLTGETLFSFIQRIRIERGAGMLVSTPTLTITQIAYACGFADSAHFSKSFSRYFGITPSAWRASGGNPAPDKSNGGQIRRKQGKGMNGESPYDDAYHNGGTTMKPEKLEVRVFAPLHLAYVRHTGPYQGDAALFGRLFGKLHAWAGPRGLVNDSTRSIIIYHDNPDITDDDKLRVSVCIEVPAGTPVAGEIGLMEFEGGRYAVGNYTLTVDGFGAAWQYMYSEWLPESGFVCDDRYTFEMYDEKADKENEFKVKICIPVKPM